MILAIGILIISLFLSSCATMFSGSTQVITIHSNVNGATIIMDGIPIGTTPFIGDIERGKEKFIVVYHEGHFAQTIRLTTKTNGWYYANLLITGITIDSSTGAVYSYSPQEYYINLRPLDLSSTDFLEEHQIRYFAMLNHSQIALEVNDDGEYLLALADLLSSKMEREVAIEAIKTAFAVSEGYQLAFGEELVRSFREYD